MKIRKKAKIRNQYNQIPHLTQDTIWEYRNGLIGLDRNSFHGSSDYCCLLITFANNLNPDQDGQNVGPDLNPNCLKL